MQCAHANVTDSVCGSDRFLLLKKRK